MEPHRLDRATARRIAVRAQLLDAERPADLLTVARRLTLLQVDPTAAVAPSADLVAWSRLGAAYAPADLSRAMEVDRTLFEIDALVRPMNDLPLYRPIMAASPDWPRTRTWLEQNDAFRRDVIERLRATGPLASRDIPDTSAVPWPSSGWTDARNVTQMLELLVMRGDVAISSRAGRERLFDLPERVYPAALPIVGDEDALRSRNARRLRALGIARAKTAVVPKEPADVGDAGEPAVIDGVRGEWRVDPEQLGLPFHGRTALLSPLDRLVHDRVRTKDVFDFEYTLEMYKPQAKRRWGYFALPILHGDRLVGKLDAIADRKAGVFRINAVHRDTPFTPRMTHDVDAEVRALAAWLELDLELDLDTPGSTP